MITGISNSITSNSQNPTGFNDTQIIIKDSVDYDFANNIINQFSNLINTFGNEGVEKLVILQNAKDSKELADLCPELSKSLDGEASIAYGIYDKKDKAICIIQDNHGRKDEKYEGSIFEQGSDTLTHEFGHLIDKKFSQSRSFKKAYKKDLENFEKELKNNPNTKIPDSDMSYLEAKDYFKHYIEGSDFSDGIGENDVTKTGHREQWAEAFSIAFDSCENKANKIHKALFKNTYQEFCNIMQSA